MTCIIRKSSFARIWHTPNWQTARSTNVTPLMHQPHSSQSISDPPSPPLSGGVVTKAVFQQHHFLAGTSSSRSSAPRAYCPSGGGPPNGWAPTTTTDHYLHPMGPANTTDLYTSNPMGPATTTVCWTKYRCAEPRQGPLHSRPGLVVYTLGLGRPSTL